MGTSCSKFWVEEVKGTPGIEHLSFGSDDEQECKKVNGVSASDATTFNRFKELNISRADFVLKKGAKFTDYYDIKETIGRGAFGSVEKCIHKRTKRAAAVKVLKKSNFNKKELELIVNEISIIKELDHPNILKIYEAY